MKKILIELLLIFIPSGDARVRTRIVLRSLSLKSLKDMWGCVKSKNKDKKNTILLYELNDCHSEIMPGYAKYFIDLGFSVDIITRKKNTESDAFCEFGHDVNMFELNPLFIWFFKFIPLFKTYKKIIILSSEWYMGNVQVVKYLGVNEWKNVIQVEHDIENKGNSDVENSITLWNFEKGKMVNPNYFGNFEIHKKNEITNFIVVGSIEGFRKNYGLLFDAVKYLDAKNDKFKITVIGKGNLEGIDEKYQKYFDIKGRLSFSDMYDEMQNGDYFLTLLDYESEEHKRYLTSGVTGSIQLILGFATPPIIQKNFANFYSFNENNSIVYEKNDDMGMAMERAMNNSESSYSELGKNLIELRDGVNKKSQYNLKIFMEEK